MSSTTYGGLSPKQLTFAKVLAETGNAVDAYRAAYPESAPKARYINQTASNIANNPKVKALVEEIVQGCRTQFALMAPEALYRLEELAKNADSEKVRYEANKEILYGAGLKPPEQIQMAQVGVFGMATPEEMKAIAKANAEDMITKDKEATA